MSLGFDPAGFWCQTLRTYLAHTRGAIKRLEREQSDRAWLAWHVEGLARTKTLPDAEKFILGRAVRKPAQSPDVLLAMGMALAANWGAIRK